MRFISVLLLLLFWADSAIAQTFFPLPGPVLEKEVAFGQANECYIFFDNPSGDTLQLRWRSFSVSKPEDWIVDLCDYGLCYAGIPPNGTMNPVYDTIQPYLKLIVQPGTSPGSAWLWFRVFEKDHEENAVDVYFSLYTPGTTGVAEPPVSKIDIFPNPAFDVLFLENNGTKHGWPTLMNAAGQQLYKLAIPAGEQAMVDVSAWPGGIYYVMDGRRVQQILIQR
ncbi:MAG: hypothetical protein EPGJADBJ_01902 [Saprospiraceae bacterium]|nr:hypothetical protein [Saprospiraceae bacterium]